MKEPTVYRVNCKGQDLLDEAEHTNKPLMTEIKKADIVISTTCKISNSKAEPEDFTKKPKTRKCPPRESAKKKRRGNPAERSPALVALVQENTRMIAAGEGPLFDCIMFDEGHHTPAPTWKLVLDGLGDVPYSDDGKEMKPWVIFSTGTPERIEGLSDFPLNHSLTPFTIRDAMMKDPSCIPESAGPFVKRITFLNVLYQLPQPTGAATVDSAIESTEPTELEDQMAVMRVAAHLLQEKRKESSISHRALVTVKSKEQCENLCEALNAAKLQIGQPEKDLPHILQAAAIHSDVTIENQADLMRRFTLPVGQHADIIDVLINVTLITESYDEAIISVCAVLSKYKSRTPVEQFMGRAVRRHLHGVGTEIKAKDNVCHVLSHARYEQHGVFHSITERAVRGSTVIQKDDDGLLMLAESIEEAQRIEEEKDECAITGGTAMDATPARVTDDGAGPSAAPSRPCTRQTALALLPGTQTKGSKTGTSSQGSSGQHGKAEGQPIRLRRFIFPIMQPRTNQADEEAEAHLWRLERGLYFKDTSKWQVEDATGFGHHHGG
eukprot:357677-Chlamydomonas_euryale.AAC.1